MASKTWTLGYTVARVQNAVEAAVSHLSNSAPASYRTALMAGLNALRTKDLTSAVCMTGSEMSPTLNSSVEDDSIADRLLMRHLPRLTSHSIYAGDVIAFKPPLGMEGDMLVRRVAAVEGEEMVSDDPEDEAFTLPEGHYWVLADKEELQAKQANDSRTFGPLPIEQVLGRIIYFVRSQTDHGPVQNSKRAALTDRAVLAAELDVEKLLNTQC